MSKVPRNLQAGMRLPLALCLVIMAPPAMPSDGLIAGSRFQIIVSGTCIDAEVNGAPLGLVAQALQAQANIQVTLNDPRIAAYPISARISSCAMDKSIRQLLNGLSYVVSASPRGRRVVVLSSDAVDGSDLAALSKSGPQTLDEFRRIAVPDETDDAETAASDQGQLRDAMLQRALDALKSPYSHLHADAIEQLATLEDRRATDALIQIAEHGPSRGFAAEALSRIALLDQTADPSLVAALKQLAVDPDADVRRVASLAVEQIRGVESYAAENQ